MTVDINRPDEDTMWKLLKENPGNAVGAILRLSWLQGMTREEICSLTWGDIYTEKKIIALKDREIPLNDDTQQCLHLRITASSNMSPYGCKMCHGRHPALRILCGSHTSHKTVPARTAVPLMAQIPNNRRTSES